jgi:hypothetical protein
MKFYIGKTYPLGIGVRINGDNICPLMCEVRRKSHDRHVDTEKGVN